MSLTFCVRPLGVYHEFNPYLRGEYTLREACILLPRYV